MSHDSHNPRTDQPAAFHPEQSCEEPTEAVLPQEVVSNLRALAGAEVRVPGEVDQAILDDARAVLAASAQVRRKVLWRRWAAGLATAGSLAALLVVSVLPAWQNSEMQLADRTMAPTAATAAKERDLAADAIPSEASMTDASTAVAATSPRAIAAAEIVHDINGDGIVDILDAYVLAQRIEQDRATVGDINHDGQINDQDIQLVAMTAVRL